MGSIFSTNIQTYIYPDHLCKTRAPRTSPHLLTSIIRPHSLPFCLQTSIRRMAHSVYTCHHSSSTNHLPPISSSPSSTSSAPLFPSIPPPYKSPYDNIAVLLTNISFLPHLPSNFLPLPRVKVQHACESHDYYKELLRF